MYLMSELGPYEVRANSIADAPTRLSLHSTQQRKFVSEMQSLRICFY